MQLISILIMSIIFTFADNTIEFTLPDYKLKNDKLNFVFDINLPPGQKLNQGANSHLELFEKNKTGEWSILRKIDLNRRVNFFGDLEEVQIERVNLSENSNQVKVSGTLYHCPKKNVKKGKSNICIIQNFKGIAKGSPSGAILLKSKIQATMSL